MLRSVALTQDWRDEDDPGVQPSDLAMLHGTIIGARYEAGADRLVLTYADGREGRIQLIQCRTHWCDETNMVVQVEDWIS